MAITMMSTITKAIGGPTSKHFSPPTGVVNSVTQQQQQISQTNTQIPFHSQAKHIIRITTESCNSQNTTNYEDYYLYSPLRFGYFTQDFMRETAIQQQYKQATTTTSSSTAAATIWVDKKNFSSQRGRRPLICTAIVCSSLNAHWFAFQIVSFDLCCCMEVLEIYKVRSSVFLPLFNHWTE